MNKTKIDWCDKTWNPVTGCLNDCPYCYARGIANRFGGAYDNLLGGNRIIQPYEVLPEIVEGVIHTQMMIATGSGDTMTMRKAAYPMGFAPTYHKLRLEDPALMIKPKNIFVCSMADIFGEWVPDEWIREVFQACAAAPQHRHIFLTKNPSRYTDLNDSNALPTGNNFWFGTTITQKSEQRLVNHTPNYYGRPTPTHRNAFINFEPLLDDSACDLIKYYGYCYKWVIVGAETGNRKGKVIPKREWIMDIKAACEEAGIPLFMKESLKRLMGPEFIQQFPW
ncbi:MAG: DUF5131 family protein [Smithella sp.]